MPSVVAIGPTREVGGFALAGARVIATETDHEVLSAWDQLGDEVGLVILSSGAGRVLADRLTRRRELLTAVLP